MTRSQSHAAPKKAGRGEKYVWKVDGKALSLALRLAAVRNGYDIDEKHRARIGAKPGLTALAEASGVDKSMVSKLLNEPGPQPAIGAIAALAWTLGASLDELVGLPPPSARHK